MVSSVKCNIDKTLPKCKISFGETLITSKYDTLFGNTCAYRISKSEDLDALSNLVDILLEIIDETKIAFNNG